MPEADVTRKRSRSPSDSDQPKQKRANTGAANDSLRSSHSTSLAGDVKMENRADDTAASTPDAKGPQNDIPDRPAGDAPETRGDSATTTGAPAPSGTPAAPSATIHMRCLIVTQDASIIIGKAGTHVNEIREKSGARVMVSESIPGNPERILNVSGPLDAVSKAFGLIVRRINDEPFDKPSVPGSRAVTIKFMIPNSRMGPKIKEIQDASGARLNASEGMLPGSTERLLSVSGVADAIHIATYYIGNILIEANERMPQQQQPPPHQARPPYMGSTYVPGYTPAAAHNPYAGGPAPPAPPRSSFRPNRSTFRTTWLARVRSRSWSLVRRSGMNGAPAPAGSEGERLVVITGSPANIQMAVQLLYSGVVQRLEQEKQKQIRQQSAHV
ncbi:uncharacterized protein BXZ73DRAFT_90593 [Epithele typhae]|uniref:uncharacterized protein n=1 Tax=Epithele typhae TaxID=378194 RepID=UPI002008C0E9|nr:uncharacterized protein BXZ73DRAFT_90593 [Epithele typhae]KAH9928545.1 hypothetical protein BXZ73DRAFT_90593 [Epithele typhae]